MHLTNKKQVVRHPLNIWLTKAIRPAVLLIDDSVAGRRRLAGQIRAASSIEVIEVGTPLEAAQALRQHSFDVLVYALTDWEEGVQLYMEALLCRPHPFQLILYVPDPTVVGFSQQVRMVRKPDPDGLLAAVRASLSSEGVVSPGAEFRDSFL
jgi:hypothetical protein